MKKVLILTYYWPPSGGSGVQRWMYFAKYLSLYGYEPLVVTVDEKYASYANIDTKLLKHVEDIKVFKTKTFEPLKLYSLLTSGSAKGGIPQGGVSNEKASFIKKMASYIRGNYFIPDARKGWVNYANKAAEKVIQEHNIDTIITTGPPHSTHLVGLKLKNKYNVKWIADLRDPWSNIYYNNNFYRTEKSKEKDSNLERQVLENADINLTIGIKLKELLADLYPINPEKFRHIYNGYDSDLMQSIQPEAQPHFEMTFIGLLTEHQPYQSIIETIKQFLVTEAHPNLKLCIAGRIAPDIIKAFENISDKIQVINKGYITHQEAVQLMANSNCLLNCLAEMDNSEILISGKQMEYVSTGNPVLCFGNTKGESALILNQLDNACMVEKEDIITASAFLKNLYSNWKNGHSIKNDTFSEFIQSKSRINTTKNLAEILDELTKR